jgi:hypothetical protein
MTCNDEYNALTKATERLHELYYQQENVDSQFSNAKRVAQNSLISAGLARLITASTTEIIYSLENSLQEELVLLHDASVTKAQVDATILAAEEAYRYASERYEECIKQNTEPKKSIAV